MISINEHALFPLGYSFSFIPSTCSSQRGVTGTLSVKKKRHLQYAKLQDSVNISDGENKWINVKYNE